MSLLCLAKILRHEAVAPGHYRLTFTAPEMAQVAEPGQFVHVRCGDTLDPLLRRPLSLHGIDRVAGTLTLLYRVVGRGTELLSRLPAGATLDVMGPLGRGFYLPAPLKMTAVEQKTGNIKPAENSRPAEEGDAQGIARALTEDERAGVALKLEPLEMKPADNDRPVDNNRVPGETEPATGSQELSGAKLSASNRPVVTEALVVGGGLGVAPLLPLVEALMQRGLPVTVMLGARSADGLLAAEEFSQTGARVELATDDGSRGTPGNAVDLLKQQLEQKGFTAKPSSGAGGVDAAEHIGFLAQSPGGGANADAAEHIPGPSAGICVYACGPVPMLRAVWQLCAAYQVPLQVSLEERMGCGVGACLACVCQVKTVDKPVTPSAVAETPGIAAAAPDDKVRTNKEGAAGETTAAAAVDDRTMANPAEAASEAAKPAEVGWKYARVCVEGPVFWGEEVILDAE